MLIPLQWVFDSALSPERRGEVKAKQQEALKRLGDTNLKLDEYERMFTPILLASFRIENFI